MIRVYLTPFDDAGSFREEIEITSDVLLESIGKVTKTLDNTEFDIGVLRFNSLALKLENNFGKFSEVEDLRSIFRYKRAGSKIRLTWSIDEPPICGSVRAGECFLFEELSIYEGLLNDEASKMDIDDQVITFQVLSYDSILNKMIVPFSSLTLSDTLKDLMYKCLNQTAFTKYISILLININPSVNYTVDDLSKFENKTVKEVLEDLLLASNSTLILDGTILKIVPRAASADLKKTYYGQGSDLGNESVLDLTAFRNGQNRIINFVRFQDSNAVAQDIDSIDKWGVNLREFDFDFITTDSKRLQTANSILTEFKNPQKELTLEAVMDGESLALDFLDKIAIDYPTVYDTSGDFLPIIGQTLIGDPRSPLPEIMWAFQLLPDQFFKIMAISLDLKTETISFNIRGI